MSVADARALVGKDPSRYEHIGEFVDLPVWENGVLSDKDPESPQQSVLCTSDANVHASYAGGAFAPICVGGCNDK